MNLTKLTLNDFNRAQDRSVINRCLILKKSRSDVQVIKSGNKQILYVYADELEITNKNMFGDCCVEYMYCPKLKEIVDSSIA